MRNQKGTRHLILMVNEQHVFYFVFFFLFYLFVCCEKHFLSLFEPGAELCGCETDFLRVDGGSQAVCCATPFCLPFRPGIQWYELGARATSDVDSATTR